MTDFVRREDRDTGKRTPREDKGKQRETMAM